MRKQAPLISGLLLGLALACGGGSSSSPAAPTTAAATATGLTYTDPTGTGWRLVKDASSTSTRIVLNLVGPAGLMTRGAGFNLKAPDSVHFGIFTVAGAPVNNTNWPVGDTGVYELGNTAPVDPWTGLPVPPDPQEPILLAGAVKKGNVLSVGIFQKDRRATAKDSGVALCQIALELSPTSKPNTGDTLALTILKAKYIAEDIGAFNGGRTTYEMIEKGHLIDMPIAVGVLHAN